MSTWTSDELNKIGAAEELRIASLRSDGSMTNPVTIWVVRLGEELFVRSVNGPGAAWFRATQVRHEGHIWAGEVEKDVTFEDEGHERDDQIDAAYRAKYRRYTASVNNINAAAARSALLKLTPR